MEVATATLDTTEPAARLGWTADDAKHYAVALAKWTADGCPVRDAAEVDRIMQECCEPCDAYNKPDGRCIACRCRVNNINCLPVLNKIKMATEDCPRGKWYPNAAKPLDRRSSRERGMARVLAHRGFDRMPETWKQTHPEHATKTPKPEIFLPSIVPNISAIPGKVDVVYTLGTESKWDDNELRYSLRSLEKHFLDLGRVFIVGHKPAWLTGVVHIPMADVHRHNKDANLIDKILAACQSGLSDSFVFMSDDQAFLSPVKFSDMKPLYCSDLAKRADDSFAKDHSWQRRLKAARDVLMMAGYPALNYDSHCPTPYSRDAFVKAATAFDYRSGNGYTINTLCCNAMSVKGEPVRGKKVTCESANNDAAKIRESFKGRWYLGYNDGGLTEAFKTVIAETFAEKSRWEGDGVAVQPKCPICDFLDPIPDPELCKVPKGWASLPEIRDRHIAALRELAGRTFTPPDNLKGDGVVLCGEGKYWPGIVVAVRLLRELGCELPVQVWHNGPIGPELDRVDGVRLIDAREFRQKHPARILRGWEIKTYAILHSGFRRVLYLDADAYAVADPTPLFELLDKTPFVFWADLPKQNKAVKWEWTGIDGSAYVPAVQGGQIFIDCPSFWRELAIAHWLNMHSDYFYQHQHGDQDSWKISMAATKAAYTNLGRVAYQSPALICRWNNETHVVHRVRGKLYPALDGTPPIFCDGLPLESRVHEIYSSIPQLGPAKVFANIYETKKWGTDGGGSGRGSGEAQRKPYVELINAFLRDNNARVVVDLGCGSGVVTKELEASEIVGVDVYRPNIEALQKERPGQQWRVADLDADREGLPPGDVALLKDVLMHWPNTLVKDWLTWAAKCGKWKWLVFTQDHHQKTPDAACQLGRYRALHPDHEPLKSLPGVRLLASYANKSVFTLATGRAGERTNS